MNCRFLATLILITSGLFSLHAKTSISVPEPVDRFRFPPVIISEQLVISLVDPGHEYVITLTEESLLLSVADVFRLQSSNVAKQSKADGLAKMMGATISDASIPVALSDSGTYGLVINEGGTNATHNGSGNTLWLDYTSAVNLQIVSVTSGRYSKVVTGKSNVADSSFAVSAIIQNVNCFGGCFFDTSFVTTQPAQTLQITLDSIRNQNCLVDGYLAIEVSGGSGPYQLNWQDNNSDSPIRDNLTGGLAYILDVTDNNGCMVSDTFRPIDERSTVVATIAAPDNVLTCSTTGITLAAGGNNPQPVNYEWLGPDGTVIGNGDDLLVILPGIYQVSVTDPANGCSDVDNFTITRTADTLTLVFLDTYVLDCAVNSVDLAVEATNFNGPATYTWFNETMTQIGTDSTLPGIIDEGIYTARGVRDDNNCETVISTTVSVDREEPQATVAFPTLLSCSVDIATSEVQITNVPNPVYNWSTTDGNITGSLTSPSITANQPGTYFVRVTNLDNSCFLDVAAILTIDNRTLAANAGADQLLRCGDNPTVLTGTATPIIEGTLYRWLDRSGEEISSDLELLPSTAGTFVLESTHPETGCVSTDEITVTSEGPTAAAFTIQQPPCEEIGGTLTITEITGGFAPYSFLIDDLTSNEATPGTLTNISSGFHMLTVVDARGCSYSEEIQIVESATFTGSAADIEIRLGEVAVLGVSTNRSADVDQLFWNASVELSCVNCPNPEASPFASFTADVIVTDVNGCELRLQQNIYVDELNLVYAPNAFSPGIPDGFNDRFMVYGDSRFITNVNSLLIFDRWGSTVFSEKDFMAGDESKGWNGDNRGKAMPSGVYIFVTEVSLWDGRKELFRGTVNLVR